MTGIVLCGGNSSRMGTDKGLMLADGIPWALHAGQKLATLHLPVWYVVNESQVAVYTSNYITPLIVDDPALPVAGPLKGILSAHLLLPGEDLLVLACDLRDMLPAVLQQLPGHYKGYDACVYTNGTFDEPLCGIYSYAALKQVYGRCASGRLEKYSMQYVLKSLNVHRLPVPGVWQPGFNNYNTL